MSKESKEVNSPVTAEDYEKARNKFQNEEYSQEEFLTLDKLYSESFKDVKEGEIIKGKVVRIQGDNVILDVDCKQEGSIPLSKFWDSEISIGQEVDIFRESVEAKQGNLVVSKSGAGFLRIWKRVLRTHDTGEIIQGKI